VFTIAFNQSDFSIKRNLVSRQTEKTQPRQHAPVVRLLSFVLMLFVAYGAVAEATHRHGSPSKASASASTETFNNSGDAGSTSNPRSTSECLICQLHRDLFVNLFTPQLKIAAPTAHLSYSVSIAPFYYSFAETPQRGRAPPLTSLS